MGIATFAPPDGVHFVFLYKLRAVVVVVEGLLDCCNGIPPPITTRDGEKCDGENAITFEREIVRKVAANPRCFEIMIIGQCKYNSDISRRSESMR